MQGVDGEIFSTPSSSKIQNFDSQTAMQRETLHIWGGDWDAYEVRIDITVEASTEALMQNSRD